MLCLADWIGTIVDGELEAGADVAYLHDDYGSNGRPLIAVDMCRDLTLPHLQGLVARAHSADAPFVLHSC